MSKITLPQSTEQQTALFGYVVADVKAFEAVQEAMVAVGNFQWINAHHTRLWRAIETFHKENGRHPTEVELRNSWEILKGDAKEQARALEELSKALNARINCSYDILDAQLRGWQEATILTNAMIESARLFNLGDSDGAVSLIKEAAVRLDSLSEGVSRRFETIGEGAEFGKALRDEDAKKILNYGIQYYDDALGGILPRELVILGAKPGAGKTQTVTQIALTNAENKDGKIGKRVHFFALEAENHEISFRMEYRLLMRHWLHNRKVNNIVEEIPEGAISYRNWRLGRLSQEFGPYEKAVTAHMKKWLPNLNVMYKNRGNFGLAELEKGILKIAKNTDMIIIDHLHYIDVDPKNENSAYQKIIQTLRDLVLDFGIPIIVVAHLRKDWGGKNQPLLPDLADFHGSSSVGKVATTGLIMGPARGKIQLPGEAFHNTKPTLMRISKDRMGGLQHLVGCSFYDPMLEGYRKEYAVGFLNKGDSVWAQGEIERRPAWAKKYGGLVANPL